MRPVQHAPRSGRRVDVVRPGIQAPSAVGASAQTPPFDCGVDAGLRSVVAEYAVEHRLLGVEERRPRRRAAPPAAGTHPSSRDRTCGQPVAHRPARSTQVEAHPVEQHRTPPRWARGRRRGPRTGRRRRGRASAQGAAPAEASARAAGTRWGRAAGGGAAAHAARTSRTGMRLGLEVGTSSTGLRTGPRDRGGPVTRAPDEGVARTGDAPPPGRLRGCPASTTVARP